MDAQMLTRPSPDERYDVFGRFARTYLSTRVERQVYLAIVGAPADEPRTAHEISRERNLQVHEVAQVLERFERAGIVETVEVAGFPTRYPWRSDLGYLADGEGDPLEWTDPVCGMPVRPESPYRARDADGREHRFCSALCLDAFLEGYSVSAPARGERGPRVGWAARPSVSDPPRP